MLGNNFLIAGFDYDKNGNRADLYYFLNGTGNSSTAVDYTYNSENMLTSFSTSGGPVFSFDALLTSGVIDGLGRLMSAMETITNTYQGQVYSFYANQYDMRSQLTGAYRHVIIDNETIDSYSYDNAGNVQSHTYTTVPGSSSQTLFGFTGDLMTQLGGSTVGWDANGNMASVSAPAARSFTYNWDNKLRSGQMGTSSVALKYDPMGNRVWKQSTVSGQTTIRKYIVDIAGGLPTILLEIDPTDSSLKKTYIYANGEILAQHDGDSTANRYFYLHDRLGSVRELIDSSGSVVNYYTFGPFGDTRESGGSLSNPFMFASQYYDFEIGQYYMRARQYDPQLMRFTAKDPKSGDCQEPITLHKYLYCGNEPINRIDPKGEMIGDALVAAFAVEQAGIAYVAYGLSSEKEGFFLLGLQMEKMILPVMTIALASSWQPLENIIWNQERGVGCNYMGHGWNKIPGGGWIVTGTVLAVLTYEHKEQLEDLFDIDSWDEFFKQLFGNK